VPESTRVLYLIGQYPAINHGYLLSEIRHLRRLGLEISVASVNLPDRPMEQLDEGEREEAGQTYYIKSLPWVRVIGAQLAEATRNPWGYFRGLFCALGLAGGNLRRIAYHLAYFAEGVLVGRWMRLRGIHHVHASFSATVALIVMRVFPVTMSFGVYGFGELHDPVGTNLRERVSGALFVRSNSGFGRAQVMLSCAREDWPKLVHMPLGIDVDGYSPRPHRANPVPIRLLCVGRLSPEKGQAFLLDVMAALGTGIPVCLHLVGDGPDRGWLERIASQRGLEATVKFEGYLDQKRLTTLYSATDIFVLPSLAEGIPTVLIEAMAMEIPCVAPHIAGVPELIEHGSDGMLFQVANTRDLECKIRRLIDSPELRRTIGKRARERVLRDYDLGRNTERLAAVFRTQLNKGA
jgi:colanic acid/amylovoran biosynthesis glycosyltransferase